MPVIADLYIAAMEKSDIERLKDRLVDIDSFKFQDFSELSRGFSKAIGSQLLSYTSVEKAALSVLGEPVNSRAILDVAKHAATLGMARDIMNVPSITESIAVSINPPHIQALLSSSKITGSINTWRLITGMIDKENARLSSVIDSIIKSSQFGVGDFSFTYDSQLRALLKSLNPYLEIEHSLARFYERQLDLLNDVFGPLRRDIAELACDVESVKVDIAEGNKRVIHAEYNRPKVIEMLSAIIALKESQPDLSIELDDDFDAESLFDCLDEHETHYGEYAGKVKIKVLDKDKSNPLQHIIRELMDPNDIDENRLDEYEYIARRAELFFRRNFAKVLYHGLWFLAEASVSYALDNPLPADEYRSLEKRMGNSIRHELPRPSLGGNTRGGEAWEKVSPNQFAKRVDALYDLADCLVNGYNKNKANANWLEMVKLSDKFIKLPKNCSDRAINEVAALIPARIKESRSKTHKHGSTPLAFACELASHELNILKKDGKRYGIDALLRKYRAGGGLRGKQRIQSKTRSKRPRQPQKNAIQ